MRHLPAAPTAASTRARRRVRRASGGLAGTVQAGSHGGEALGLRGERGYLAFAGNWLQR